MAPKHRNASKTKTRKDSLRFVLIGPRPTSVLKFSDRLLRRETAEKGHSPRRKGPPRVGAGPDLTPARRVLASLIAAVLVCAGLAATVIGAREGNWFPGLLGPLSILYGIAWFQVAYRGRTAGGRLRLNLWRRE
jgi:hypothetical protein